MNYELLQAVLLCLGIILIFSVAIGAGLAYLVCRRDIKAMTEEKDHDQIR
jgi:hypothetical protein